MTAWARARRQAAWSADDQPTPALIAVVDDDLSMREAMADLLESLGFRTASFASAEACLESGVLTDVALILLDLQMPGMGGMGLLGRLADSGVAILVVVMTAHEGEGPRAAALAAGAAAVLAKPIDRRSLAEVLDQLPWG
ncbi:MAG TPA: response regulator [Caulobacteraceae bacterium]|nr:response regulator [Caulobacteraceae bacterium]